MTASENQKEALTFLNECITYIRENLSEEMPTQQVSVLLGIAMNPGTTFKELEQKCGVSRAANSRHIAALSPVLLPGGKKQGYGLVVAEEDPFERRRKLVRLSPKGEKFIEEMFHSARAKVAKRYGSTFL